MELEDGDKLILGERSREFYDDYIKSPKWAWMRRVALAIHGERCAGCKTTEGPFQVHHLHYETLGHEDPRDDLRVVCRRCHRIEHGFDPEEPEEEPSPTPDVLKWHSTVMARAAQLRRVRARAARLRRMRRDHHEHKEEPDDPVSTGGVTDDAKLIAETDRIAHALYSAYLHTPAWGKKRGDTFAIFGRRCAWCGTSEGPLQVHHLHYETLGREDPRHDLRPICRPCHRKEHGIEHEEEPEQPKEPEEPKRRRRIRRKQSGSDERCANYLEWLRRNQGEAE